MHISEIDVAGFIDGLLTKEDRKKILTHLSECEECFQRIAEISEFVSISETIEPVKTDKVILRKARAFADSAGTKRRAFSNIFSPAAFKFSFAAAALVIGILIYFYSQFEPANNYRDLKGNITLQVDYPQNGEDIPSGDLSFRWEEVPDIIVYNFILYDADGKIIIKTSSERNELKIDTDKIEGGKNYLWMVESLFDDGKTKQSPLISFRYGAPK